MISRVAASPSRSGIRMSISTTSARASRASRTASRPVAASPDHRQVRRAVDQQPQAGAHQVLVVGEDHAGRRRDRRTPVEAGAVPVTTLDPGRSQRKLGEDAEAAVGPGPADSRTAQGGHPLAHAHDAVPVRARAGRAGGRPSARPRPPALSAPGA